MRDGNEEVVHYVRHNSKEQRHEIAAFNNDKYLQMTGSPVHHEPAAPKQACFLTRQKSNFHQRTHFRRFIGLRDY